MIRPSNFLRGNGFTLIELTAAIALAAILMMGVLGVLRGIARDREILSTRHELLATPDLQMIVELVRRDLRCASSLRTGSDGSVEIYTTASLDAQTFEMTDRPGIVTYRIEDADNLHPLIRRQQLNDDTIEPPILHTLLALHVDRFTIEPMLDTANNNQSNASEPPSPEQTVKDITRRVRLKIAFESSGSHGSPAVDQILCIK